MIKISPVILCGGSGTRLWPLSRTGFPKQFLCLDKKESLFQQATLRLATIKTNGLEVLPPIIVTGEEHRFLAYEQLREINIDPEVILLESIGRNTAPALTLAALSALEKNIDPVLVVSSADQNISNTDRFTAAVQTGIMAANEGSIVLLGIKPEYPATEYGYLKTDYNNKEDVRNNALHGALPVAEFFEKPNIENAEKYLKEGGFFWNAGIFILKASVWLKALEKLNPDILSATTISWEKNVVDGKFVRPDPNDFSLITSKSIDHAVLEKITYIGTNASILPPLKMVQLDAGWSDLGAWDAVWNVLPKDKNGNAHIGDVLNIDSRDTLVHASSRLVSIVGVERLVVIETPDAVLIADRTRSQDVKNIVTQLSALNRQERLVHRKVHRPWGWYDTIDDGHRFKVKRILVKPKASLSLQKHHHRAEHWIVVRGTAEITNGDRKILLTENQSTYIPLGETHRLSNPGTIPLEIIEVQSGSYLGEDDIVRFEDNYGRNNN
jgi:mannose-1-phosphate guanylyltransferase/mannose-6-phosphate isomerase